MNLKRVDVVSAFRRAEERRAVTELPRGALLVEALDARGSAYAAVDVDGDWAIVVTARRSPRLVPALKLSLLSADYGAPYELHGISGVERLRVCVVRCGASDGAIRNLFATVCETLIGALPEDPEDSEVEAEVGKWVSLFRRLQMPPRATLVGLVGELTLLDRVDDLPGWVRAWHGRPTDNLDFAFTTPALSVEVKATTSQQRVHQLSIHQALPVVADHHYFASVIVELRETGPRIGDVVSELATRLAGAPESALFWRCLVGMCGSSLSDYLEIRYMRDVARGSLEFYEARAVPRPVVQLPLPAGVSAVRFTSDFSSVAPVEGKTILQFASTP